MSRAYQSAKRIALGLVLEQQETAGDDLWDISLGDDFSFNTEMPFQFFERGFEPPEEQVSQKTALMLYDDEYEDDKKDAEERLSRLKDALRSSDRSGLKKCLSETHPEEWLSLIFLDGESLKNDLVPLLKAASPECREVFHTEINKALKRLQDFKNLLESLSLAAEAD